MNRTMITATNTLAQLQKQMDMIANNMANIDTNGYKKRDATFTELMYQQFDNQRRDGAEVGRLTPNGVRQGTGARIGQTQLDMTQGNVKQADRPLDTAFTKEGQLYKVLVQTGVGNEIQYTRNGAMYLSPVGENEVALVNADGHSIVDANNNPIYITGEAKEYNIDSSGQLSVTMTNGTLQTFELGVVQVNKPQFLVSKGNNLFGLPENFAELNVGVDEILTDMVGPLRGEIGIQSHALESSNVDMAKEMTSLMNAQRAYQFQSRAVSMADQMMGLVNGIR
ncbi:flagellar hook-basal body protein [Robertmurraya yapensis]|uniref:Flagellar hook-basal body protein n=1 Tax=Bacillus yapensis TaxID=2492960 RepID=A0A431WBU8_9BACI|nr:flagellar hook-basal body protein [Bacillus yapensis]RTR32962.1 flagellar hook-basal body protein [Bacillus yapensis]TKS96785.1 flagellar hook-basal body complex protein [Bacillus yapensis]